MIADQMWKEHLATRIHTDSHARLPLPLPKPQPRQQSGLIKAYPCESGLIPALGSRYRGRSALDAVHISEGCHSLVKHSENSLAGTELAMLQKGKKAPREKKVKEACFNSARSVLKLAVCTSRIRLRLGVVKA